MSFETAEPLEPDTVIMGGVEVIAYLNSDGEDRYRIRCDGDLSLSATIGLLRLAEADIIANSSWRPST